MDTLPDPSYPTAWACVPRFPVFSRMNLSFFRAGKMDLFTSL